MTQRSNRRQFLQQGVVGAAALAAAPTFIPATSLGGRGRIAPSDKIVMGSIGTGGKGRNNTDTFLGQPDTRVVAVCDVDTRHLELATQMVNGRYENEDCLAYTDFRELVARDDIDAVCVSTPDHWHALASIAALKEGKDVYCEKPLANSVAESKAIRDATVKYGRVLQCGSHERSNSLCRQACEIVRSGRLGRLQTIRIQMPCDQDHHRQVIDLTELPPEMKVPDEFDYDMWLGHTPVVAYTERRCHFWWRFILSYGGGEMTDRGAHIIDIGQLGNDSDQTSPVEYVASGSRNVNGLYDAFMDYRFENTYANGVRLIGQNEGPRGLRFECEEGWIFVHIHGGRLEVSDPELLTLSPETLGVDLGRSPGHHRNFLDCIKSGEEPFASAEIGHRTATICHLNNIAMLTESTIRWDPETETIIGNDDAATLLTPAMREPWELTI